MGIIMGTLVGGSSTVGTAQLAYQYGMSAFIYSLGAFLACMFLAFVFAKKMREQEAATLLGMVSLGYGPKAGFTASILNTIGTFIGILSQLIAASAVVTVVFPNMKLFEVLLISGAFMVVYVYFGGTKGTGLVGIVKVTLLYIAMIACGILVIKRIGGLSQIAVAADNFTAATGKNFWSIFNRGFKKDIGSIISLIVGPLTTQIYALSVMSAKDLKAAKIGCIMSGFMNIPVGIMGVLVGLYMREVTDPATFLAKTTLTEFTLNYSGMPAIFAGLALGAFFIACVGTGACLAFGIANILVNDVVPRFTNKFDTEAKKDRLNKLFIILAILLGCLLSTGPLGDTILNFAFMSMGLRGATIFIPLCFMFWGKHKVPSNYAIASIIIGPLFVLLFGSISFLKPLLCGWDSLIIGLIVCFIIMYVGYLKGSRKLIE